MTMHTVSLFQYIIAVGIATVLLCVPVMGKEMIVNHIPYTAQAPQGDWSEPWQNACEETSIAMVDAYYRNVPFAFQPSEAILSVFEKKHAELGESKDESLEDLASFINRSYAWNATLRNTVTAEDIEKEIKKRRPVIIALDARRLVGAPYAEPKPDYHVMVIIGFDSDRREFIVHDPGTSQGKELRYGYDALLDANKEYVIGDTGEVRGGEVLFTSRPHMILRLFAWLRAYFSEK